MEISNQYSRDHEDDTHLDIDGIEDSVHPDLETADPLLLQGTHNQDALDTEGDIFPELEYIEEDDSDTPFSFDSSLD